MSNETQPDALIELVEHFVHAHADGFDTEDADYLVAVIRTLLAEEVEEAAEEAETLASEAPDSSRSRYSAQAEALSRAATIVRGQIAA